MKGDLYTINVSRECKKIESMINNVLYKGGKDYDRVKVVITDNTGNKLELDGSAKVNVVGFSIDTL